MFHHVKRGKHSTAKRQGKSVHFGLRISPELKNALVKRAQEEDRDLSYIVERAIRRELEGQG